MFCANCGKNLADDVKFCDGCGAPTGVQSAPQVAVATQAPAQKKMSKGLLIGLIAGGAAVILTVVLLLVFLLPKRYSSPEAVAKDIITAYASMDVDTMVDCIPEFMFESVGITDKNVAKEMLRARMIGSEPTTYNCTILSVIRDYSYPQDEIQEALERYVPEAFYYKAISQIQESCVVKVTAMVDGETETLEVLCVKVGGSWYALPDF